MSRRIVLLFTLACVSAAAQSPRLAWSSLIDRGNQETAQIVIPDGEGGAWVAGVSNSNYEAVGPNWPFQAQRKGLNDIYIARYRPEANGGTTLLFFTWFGGSADDVISAMRLGPDGRLYFTGYTKSTDLPLGGDTFQNTNAGSVDSFVAVIDPRLPGDASLAFSTYFGGDQDDAARAIALAPDGTIVIVGDTTSNTLNIVNGAQPVNRGGTDAFILRCTLSGIVYSSYFGGDSTDGSVAVEVDAQNQIWFAGWSASWNFPITQNAMQGGLQATFDGYLTRLDTGREGLDSLIYSTFLGGDGNDFPTAMVTDQAGTLWIGGYTTSTNLPTPVAPYQPAYSGYTDAFLFRIQVQDVPAPWLIYGTYFGGIGHEVLTGLAVRPDGAIAMTGYQMYGALPVTPSAIQPLPGSEFADGWIATLNPLVAPPAALEYSSYLGAEFNDVATSVAYDAEGALYLSGYTLSYRFPVTDGSVRTNPPPFSSGFVQKIVNETTDTQ